MSNFIENCISGDALLTEVDNYVAQWHDKESTLKLYSYLGMTKKEYALYVQDESFLACIVTAHREKKDIEEVINNEFSLAARADSQAKSERLERWLKSEGLWD